jgi:hypothetical protein
MNEDYLWDKSGTPDPEIERLENALQAFRYKETKPPALPANNVVPFKSDSKKVSSRRIFSIPIAIAASVALVALVSVLWLLVSNNQERAGNGMAANELKQGEEIPWKMPPQSVRENSKDDKVVLVPIANKARSSSTKQEQDTEIKLTDEERYAYEQLMKALKITSEKLNYIKQKTQSEEKSNSNSDSD